MNEKITRENVGERLKAARKTGNYTLAKTSEITGLTMQTIYNVETGKHPRITIGTLKILAEFIEGVENGKDFRSEV